jgi:hypothetical protein
MSYRYRETVYQIIVKQALDNVAGVSIALDGVELVDGVVTLLDDRIAHRVEVNK